MIVPPPQRSYRRARRSETFDKLFDPVANDDGALLRDLAEFAASSKGSRHWWTVVEGDSGALYAVAGIHVVNRVGLLLCRNGWGGEWADHPVYRYD
jgi:hypothetical protein